ncbi:hypothetical protein H4R33_001334 [Dimargaris cristalligena]|uniref:Uncharacterized protein n=1 Tax=Dimargaris cristalligena TaxID=215637 RepID=A0A4P9ZN65_9FUNG|nr:hypothetical protein H4R33_001334 [Dimargaris cristalligena]RKP34757.1 hypothetical protein BJ085DRAFT_33576 [Dimargaris cristalligena]|eukprot:RKP34757.1 hypothetical protein BJ085DRAFT_33576 [Dimargaris cristalligena]
MDVLAPLSPGVRQAVDALPQYTLEAEPQLALDPDIAYGRKSFHMEEVQQNLPELLQLHVELAAAASNPPTATGAVVPPPDSSLVSSSTLTPGSDRESQTIEALLEGSRSSPPPPLPSRAGVLQSVSSASPSEAAPSLLEHDSVPMPQITTAPPGGTTAAHSTALAATAAQLEEGVAATTTTPLADHRPARTPWSAEASIWKPSVAWSQACFISFVALPLTLPYMAITVVFNLAALLTFFLFPVGLPITFVLSAGVRAMGRVELWCLQKVSHRPPIANPPWIIEPPNTPPANFIRFLGRPFLSIYILQSFVYFTIIRPLLCCALWMACVVCWCGLFPFGFIWPAHFNYAFIYLGESLYLASVFYLGE